MQNIFRIKKEINELDESLDSIDFRSHRQFFICFRTKLAAKVRFYGFRKITKKLGK